MKRLFSVFCLGLIYLSLTNFVLDDMDEFYIDVEAWHTRRINALKKPTGWLSLAGLFWLKEGENTFGSAKDNDIIFPDDTPKYMGTYILSDSIVTVKINKNVQVLQDSLPVTTMVLKNDTQDETTILSFEHYNWYIIRRQDKYGIRLKDLEHPNLKNFTDIERFPVDIKWRVKAHLEKYNPPKILKIPNVLGQIEEEVCPGALVFELDGKKYSLDPISVRNGERYWLIFGDETNEVETYGAGRFLYTDGVDENGETYIDFNQSYNPPCVFTPYATCPLPPKQNILKIRITAGEKNWNHDNH